MTDGIHRATNFAEDRRQTPLGRWLDTLPPIQERDTVYRAPNAPAFSSVPYADTTIRTIAGGLLKNQGAYPWTFGDRSDGPPPGMSCPGGMRYSASNRMWYCPTGPCTGERPHDRAYCDVISRKWVVPTVSGQQPPLSGSLVQMDQCAVDPNFPPFVGNRGSLECDLRTGRLYFDGDDGNYSTRNDYSAIRSTQSYYEPMRTGRDGLKVVSTRQISAGSQSPNFSQTVGLDRAYTGYTSMAVPFADGRGRLHPSQTGVGLAHKRVRGHWQQNRQTHPVASAVARPGNRVPRAGYMTTSLTDKQQRYASMLTPFTDESMIALNQASMRPQAGGQLLESDAVIHRFSHR